MNTKIDRTGFALLKALAADNSRDWYRDNKDALNERVREPFARILQAASVRLSATPIPLSGGPKTMFRQHRDTRFSKDKRPLKTNVSGMLTPSGTKQMAEGLVYLHLEPGESFIAAGFYQLSPKDLKSLRERIIDDDRAFESMLAHLQSHGLELAAMDALKKMPRGFESRATHRFADYLRFKSFIARESIPQTVWNKGLIVDRVVAFVDKTAPLLRW